MQKKAMSIRLSAEQEEALSAIARELTVQRPDLLALSGDVELSIYATMKIALGLGIKQLQDQVREARKGAKR